MKASINGVLCQKTLHFEPQAASMPVSSKSMARQIILHEECLNKNFTAKNRGLQALDNLTDKPMMFGEQCSTSA